MATSRCQDDLCLKRRHVQTRNYASITTNSFAMSIGDGLDSVAGQTGGSTIDIDEDNEMQGHRRAMSEPAGDSSSDVSSSEDDDVIEESVAGGLNLYSNDTAGANNRNLFPIVEDETAVSSSDDAPSCAASAVSPLSPQEDLELKYRFVCDAPQTDPEPGCAGESGGDTVLNLGDKNRNFYGYENSIIFESPTAGMLQRRLGKGGNSAWHRLSAISEAADDRAASSADEEVNIEITEVQEFHDQFEQSGANEDSRLLNQQVETLRRPQPEGLAYDPHGQHQGVTQVDEREYQPTQLCVAEPPAGGLVTAVASSRALLLDCTSAASPAAAASTEEVEVRVTTEATGPNPSVALARAAARAAGAASAAVKNSRKARRNPEGGPSTAEAEYRIFISTSCTLRATQPADCENKLENKETFTQPRPEEDVVEIHQVMPQLEDYRRWAVAEAVDVECAFISDSEPGSPTPSKQETSPPISSRPEPSALLTSAEVPLKHQQQQRGRSPGPNSFQADQRRLQAARDAYTAVKAAPARPRPSRSLPRLSSSISSGGGGRNSEASSELRWSDTSASSTSLRQLRQLLADKEALHNFSPRTDGLADSQQPRHESASAPKSMSLFDLLSKDIQSTDAHRPGADVSHSCASLLETDTVDSLTSDEGLKKGLKRIRLPSNRRAPEGAQVRSASLFFEWLERRAKSERELSVCRSLTRLEAPVWLDNLAKNQSDTPFCSRETRRSWRPSVETKESSSTTGGSAELSTWRLRSIHSSLSLPMRLSQRTTSCSEQEREGTVESENNARTKQTDRLDGEMSQRSRYFTQSSLNSQARQAAAARPRPLKLSELAARLPRPPLLPVTLTPQDFQPKSVVQTAFEDVQATSSSDASAIMKRDSGASMASVTSSLSASSPSSETSPSSASSPEELEKEDKGEESTVVQTSIVHVFTRVLHPTVDRRQVAQPADAELLPGLLLCQADPTGSPADTDPMTSPKLLKLADARQERQRSRLAEWRRDTNEGCAITERQAELLAADGEMERYFQTVSKSEDELNVEDRPVSPSLADDDVLVALGDGDASGELARVLVALGGTKQRKLLQPQRSLAESCQGVVREGMRYLLECANPSCARRCELAQRLQDGFRSCRECRTYYCSRKCRSDHAGAHGRSCCRTRTVDACKRLIAGCLLAEDSTAAALLSRLARAAARSYGWRGCILLALRDAAAVARFVATEGVEGLMRPPVLLDCSDLSGDLADACRSCDPNASFVVCVTVGRGIKWAKLRMSPFSSFDLDAEAEDSNAARRHRRAYVSKVERLLRERGVSFRRQFPQLRERLLAYADSGEPFQPTVVYPNDRATGRAFACRLAPDRDPEIEWVPLAVAVTAEEQSTASVADVSGDPEAAPRHQQQQAPFYRRRRVVSTDL